MTGLANDEPKTLATIKAKKQLLVQYQPYKTNLGHIAAKKQLNSTRGSKNQQKLNLSEDQDIFSESLKRIPVLHVDEPETRILAPVKSIKDLRNGTLLAEQNRNFFDMTMGPRLPNLKKPVSTLMRGIVNSLQDPATRQMLVKPKELSSRVREQISKEYAYLRVDYPQQTPQTPTKKDKNRSGTKLRSKETLNQLTYKALNFPHYKAGDFPGANPLVEKNYRHQIYF